MRPGDLDLLRQRTREGQFFASTGVATPLTCAGAGAGQGVTEPAGLGPSLKSIILKRGMEESGERAGSERPEVAPFPACRPRPF